jgi:predicted transcriptional regulator
LTDYKRITVRLPPRTVARLEALAGDLQITQWRVMVQALDAYADVQAEMNARRSRTG